MRGKTKPNILFEGGPDWNWDSNLQHWYCVLPNGMKAFIWEDIIEPPETKKLSKSSDEEKHFWDGICLGIPGGPEISDRQRPILDWIRNNFPKESS